VPGTAAKVRLTEKQLSVLEELSRSRTVSVATATRARIILLGFRGIRNEDISPQVGLNRHQVGRWRKRWRNAWDDLCLWECSEPQRLREGILKVLSDAPRPGAGPRFTAEQVARIVAVACESPALSGRPIARWTQRELREEVIHRGIVESISSSHVGRILSEAAVQPHRRKMWLTTKEKDPEKFQQQVETVCETYRQAPELAASRGTHTVSVDEATALQAIERSAPDKPVQPGQVARHEFEYTRHGTTTLTAGLDVVLGELVAPTLEPTRTEPEFVAHIRRTVSLDPEGEWIFVLDNLNTHLSADLVRWVAQALGINEDLGLKKKARDSEVDGDAAGVSVGPEPSHPVRVPAKAQFVAQSDRDCVRRHQSQMPAGRQFFIGGRAGNAAPAVHRLLQPHDGSSVRLDLHRPTAGETTSR
jgi:transposase